FLAHHRRATGGASPGHLPGAAVRGPGLGNHADDLGNDVARAAQEHAVADAHVLPPQLVLVVEGGAADRHAADVDRLERGDRPERSGASDADEDVLDGGGLLLGGELPGDGPARGPRDRAQAATLVLGVDLDHAAVDLVRQLVALAQHAAVLVPDRVQALHQLV